jgi:hypothetical protein
MKYVVDLDGYNTINVEADSLSVVDGALVFYKLPPVESYCDPRIIYAVARGLWMTVERQKDGH